MSDLINGNDFEKNYESTNIEPVEIKKPVESAEFADIEKKEVEKTEVEKIEIEKTEIEKIEIEKKIEPMETEPKIESVSEMGTRIESVSEGETRTEAITWVNSQETSSSPTVSDSVISDSIMKEQQFNWANAKEEKLKVITSIDSTGDSESYIKKSKKDKFKRTIAVVAVASILGGSTFGFGLGMAIPISQNYFASKSADNSSQMIDTFSFPGYNIGEEEILSVGAISQEPISQGFSSVIAMVEPSVVRIVSSVEREATNNIFGFNVPTDGEGSGLIFHADDKNYYIVTNHHVVDSADSVSVYINEEGPINAKPVGKNEISDISVISVSIADVKQAGINNVAIAKFGDSDSLNVGDVVIAIGNALGEGNTATNGIISAKNKKIVIDKIEYYALQTNAAINPGNSGGPLVNLAGEVIGINSAKLSSSILSSSRVEGMGYSIPSNEVKIIIEEIMNGPSRPMIGIIGTNMTEELAKQYNLPQAGALITEVLANSPAEAIGLSPMDVITGFNGRTVFSFEDLKEALSECSINDKIEIKYITNGSELKTSTITLFSMNDASF